MCLILRELNQKFIAYLFKGGQEQSFFLQTLLFTAFLVTVLKIITYAPVSTSFTQPDNISIDSLPNVASIQFVPKYISKVKEISKSFTLKKLFPWKFIECSYLMHWNAVIQCIGMHFSPIVNIC